MKKIIYILTTVFLLTPSVKSAEDEDIYIDPADTLQLYYLERL